MRKILLRALLVILFTSCSKSLEDKANTLIEEDIKRTLYHPETYDPAETQVGSALTPFDDPVFHEKTIQLCKIGMFIDEYDRKMKSARSSMSVWNGPYRFAYDKNEYQEAKDEYNENAQNKKVRRKKQRNLQTN